jgi:outer membrane murein-binding lipoprotein Lpp
MIETEQQERRRDVQDDRAWKRKFAVTAFTIFAIPVLTAIVTGLYWTAKISDGVTQAQKDISQLQADRDADRKVSAAYASDISAARANSQTALTLLQTALGRK